MAVEVWTFYALDVTVRGASAGQISLDLVSARQGTSDVPTTAGPALSFSTSAVPEPSS